VSQRKALPPATRMGVLHEAGYKCSNPACRMVITLDFHHIEYVAEGGGDSQDNLLALCPNCHSLHHKGHIPRQSLRAWKFLLLALNEGFDRRSVDTLLALDVLGGVMVWGDGLLGCAALVASGLVDVDEKAELIERDSVFFGPHKERQVAKYWVKLSTKGHTFVQSWKRGDQAAAVQASEAVMKRRSIRRPLQG
jgi:hypothetical protein